VTAVAAFGVGIPRDRPAGPSPTACISLRRLPIPAVGQLTKGERALSIADQLIRACQRLATYYPELFLAEQLVPPTRLARAPQRDGPQSRPPPATASSTMPCT
jgi:hypothetical protein